MALSKTCVFILNLILMVKSFSGYIFLVGIPFLPVLAFAETISTNLDADKITVLENGVIHAEGNVEIRSGKNFLKANSLKYDQKTNQIDVDQIIEYYDGSSSYLTGEKGTFNAELTEGIISAAQILLDNIVKISADDIKIHNGNIDKVEGIWRVTSCDECEGEKPLWHLKALTAENDIRNSNIIYRNVSVWVKGFPIGYMPYLRLPHPTIDRARGFLIPSLVLTSSIGSGLKIPYFIPIGRSRDILITPYLSSKTKTVEYRYRQILSNGNLLITGAVSDDDVTQEKTRAFLRAQGKLLFPGNISLNFDSGSTTDNSYLLDYSYNDTSDFDTRAIINKTDIERNRYIDATLEIKRDFENRQLESDYFAISQDYSKRLNFDNLPGNLSFNTSLNSAANFDEESKISRPPSSASVGLGYSQTNGVGPILFHNNLHWATLSFVNAGNDSSIDDDHITKFGASTKLSFPYQRKRSNNLEVINPQILFSVNDQINLISGDFFVGGDKLSFGNLMAGNKMTSMSESALGYGVSLGLDFLKYYDSGKKLKFFLGSSWLEGNTYSPGKATGLEPQEFNYLTGFSYTDPNKFEVFGETRISEDGILYEANLKSVFPLGDNMIKLDYDFINADIDPSLSKHIKTTDLAFAYKYNDLHFSANGSYDLQENAFFENKYSFGFSYGFWDYLLSQNFEKQNSDKISLSAVYNDECTRVKFSFDYRSQQDGVSDSVKTLKVQINLIPFADFSYSSAFSGANSSSTF